MQTEFINMLRTEVRDANFTSANTLARNAVAHVQNTLRWFEADAACVLAGEQARMACQRLAQEVSAMAPSESLKTVIAERKSHAFDALDTFEKECRRCGPSEMAKALGV